MRMRHFLVDTFTHLPPAHALENLTPDAAERRIDGANHSVAELVAHMDFWQRWFSARCEGQALPMAAAAADGWPVVTPGSWPAIERGFLEGLEQAAALGDDEASLTKRIEPAIEFPPLAEYTRREALIHVAGHNAHHLGQVILLRQIMGLWPPPKGSWTW